jgi:hypothetical protein
MKQSTKELHKSFRKINQLRASTIVISNLDQESIHLTFSKLSIKHYNYYVSLWEKRSRENWDNEGNRVEKWEYTDLQEFYMFNLLSYRILNASIVS